MAAHCNHDPAGVLGRLPLFASLTPAECADVVRRSVCRAVHRGERLFRAGEPCRGLYVVLEGDVRVYRSNGQGAEQVLGVFGPGEPLGEAALFDGGAYLASARAVEEARVLFVPAEVVHALYATHPEVARQAVRELSGRVRMLTALVDRLVLSDVPARVAAAVLAYAERAHALAGVVEFRLPRTQEALAAELATTRESVARALHDLRQAGVIRQRRSRIAVLDVAALRQRAGCTAPTPRPGVGLRRQEAGR